MMRGNHLSARSTACSEATSVARARLARGDERADGLVGERRIERRYRLVGEDQLGPLVQHAGDADALQLAAREPVAAVEEAVVEVEAGERRRAPRRVAAATSSDASARQTGQHAEPAGEHGGDDAQARRDRRRLVDDADAARAAAAAPRADSAHGSAPATTTRPSLGRSDVPSTRTQRRLAGARRAR